MGNASSASAAMEEGTSQPDASGNVAVTTEGSSSDNNTGEGAPSFGTTAPATKTPAHRGHISMQPQPSHPAVTTEKKAGKASAPTKFSITCPGNKVVQLSPTSCSKLLLGRGQHGVPASVVHVSRQACVVRLVRSPTDGDDNKQPSYHLEMTVMGSQNCVLTGRDGKSIAVKNISAIIKAGDNDTTPSTVQLKDGDVIEPYDRPVDQCSVDEAKIANTYFGYAVTISSEGGGEGDKDAVAADGASFVEASRRIDQAVAERPSAAAPAVSATTNDDMVEETQVFSVPRPERTDVEMAEANGQTGDSAKHGAKGVPGETVMEEIIADAAEKMSAVDASRKQAAASGDHTMMEAESPRVDAPLREAASGNDKTDSSEESEEEEYDFDDPRQEIIDILEGIESPGNFAVGGCCGTRLLMPGLVIDGVGHVGLPLSETQAKELANRCEQAPFGRGEKTLLDKAVRNTFQLAPEHIQITNPSWSSQLAGLTKEVCETLGVQSNLTVEAKLYKMLLYEKGSHFKPHRDSEKEHGMFGTMVIVLPSHYTGGELVVKHKGEVETFDQSSVFSSHYAALYADCRHELKEVTSGHRLCLVYNLVKTGAGERPVVSDNVSTIKRLKAAVDAWSSSFDSKIVLMTDHLYTPAGIRGGEGSSRYKGSDAAVVELLERAVEKGASLDFDHGTVTYSESGYAEDNRYGGYHRGYGYGRRRWYDYDDDDDGDYEWAETTDSTLNLTLASYGSVSICGDNEMVPSSETYFEDKGPSSETFEPTGNEGINGERQYADSEAIVIWPRSQRWIITTNNNTAKMCDYLALACTPGTVESNIESLSGRVSKADMLVTRVMGNEANTKKLVECILMLGNKDVANKFLTCCASQQTLSASRSVVGRQLQGLVDAFGEEVSQFFTSVLVPRHFTSDPAGFCDFFVKTHGALQMPSHAGLVERLISSFTDAMCPTVQYDVTLSKSFGGNFPLKALLKIVESREDCASLTKRILQGYIWISCQKRRTASHSYYRSAQQTQDPEGPTLLTSVSSSIASVYDKADWEDVEPVLTSAVEKLCQLGHPDVAINFVGALLEVAPAESPAGSDSADRKKLCARLASVACAKTINDASFRADPTSTATFFVKCCGILRKQDVSKEQALVESFVNVLCPSSRVNFSLKKSIHTFPLSDVLNELVKGNHGQIGIMGKRVVEGYLWLSSQHHVSSSDRGPVLLASASAPLKAICDKVGWDSFEMTFGAAVQKLCDKKDYDGAILLMRALSGPSGSNGVCNRLATTVARNQLADQTLFRVATIAIQNLKKLVLIISEHCPSLTQAFIEKAKTLDVGSILYPFVTDANIRMSTSTYVKNATSTLALVCAQNLQSQITATTGTVAIWSLSNAHLSSNTLYSSFLRDPCQKEKDWKVRKSDHAGFQRDLQQLIRRGDVSVKSYQPLGRGAYHFRITKLRSVSVPISSLISRTCSCSGGGSRYSYAYGTSVSTTCLINRHKTSSSRNSDVQRKIDTLKRLLTSTQLSQLAARSRPPAAARAVPAVASVRNPYARSSSTTTSIAARAAALAAHQAARRSSSALRTPVGGKRQASDVIDLLDDEVQVQGVVGSAEAIRKRVKAAADKGDIVEIE